MCNSDRRHFLAMSLVTFGAVGIGGAALAAETAPKKKVYVCPPCGCAADGKEFAEPGTCPECGMPLVEKSAEPDKPAPKDAAYRFRANKAEQSNDRGQVQFPLAITQSIVLVHHA